MNCQKVTEVITKWLTDKATDSKQNGFVIGISGGVDSAVVSALCAHTGLPTLAISMPIRQEATQLARASEQLAWLESFKNISTAEVNLTNSFDTLTPNLCNLNTSSNSTKPDSAKNLELACANLRSRLRMGALYFYANCFNYLVVGTGNRVEDFGVAFFTKYGDGGVDLSPIGELMKSEVFELAKFLGIPESIQKAKPTDGLWGEDRNDETQLGDTYNDLEIAMRFCDENSGFDTIKECDDTLKIFDGRNEVGFWVLGEVYLCLNKEDLFKTLKISEKTLRNYIRRHENSAHKMAMPPICPIR